MTRLQAGLVVLGTILAAPRPSEACTCGSGPDFFAPADGAVDVALDVRVLYRVGYGAQLTLHAGEQTIEAAGVEHPDARELAPLAPLAPRTTYELRLDGVPRARFTTGERASAATPAAPDVRGLEVEQAVLDGWADSCLDGNPTWVDLDVQVDPAATAYAVRFTRSTGLLDEQWLFPEQLNALHDVLLDICGLQSVLIQQGSQACVELAARGGNGSLSGYTRHCTEVERCAPIPFDELNPGGNLECRRATSSSDGGCNAAGGAAGWPLVLLLLLFRRRR